MSLISRGQAALVRRQKLANGRKVVYTRGTEAVTVVAWPGQSELTAATQDETVIAWTARDYLFEASELAIAGTRLTPQEGDRIADAFEDGEERVYELILPPGGGNPWRWSDLNQTTYRVHTKRVKAL